jgi:DNA-binding response OmpR family regulator
VYAVTSISETQTVLVIDDDPDLLPFLADMLSVMTSYRIITATNGVQGLERYVAYHPDCIIVDVKMPELDGYQFVRALRGDPDSMATPLIMLTAMGSDESQFIGLASGADQYLVKPVDPEALIASVQRALLLGESERQQRLEQMALETNDDGTTER